MMTLRFGTIVMVAAAALAVGVGCGNSTGSGGNGGNGGNAGSGGSGGGTNETAVNGCAPSKAADMTSSSAVSIKFGGTSPGLAYSPKCFKVKKGSTVTFEGEFAQHPLSGGTVKDDGSATTPDKSSPIKETKTGSKATFTLADAGTFGFFCEFHFGSGMKGAVIVE